jgi:hypothetical protein
MTDFILEQIDTWPSDLLVVLARHASDFAAWNASREDDTTDRYAPLDQGELGRSIDQYECAIANVSRVLALHRAKGFHCTKLTDGEIANVRANGMSLPNPSLLERRLNVLVTDNQITREVANRLCSENQAADTFRRDMLWFCFFEPSLAGQGGIERFFRSWGGEALYNSHEEDAVTGKVLGDIGTPCVVEAWVSLSQLSNMTGLADKVGRRFCVQQGHAFKEPTSHEGPIKTALCADSIEHLHLYPSNRFKALTLCDGWNPKLAL